MVSASLQILPLDGINLSNYGITTEPQLQFQRIALLYEDMYNIVYA
jgi:hypothetical protein